MLDAIRAGWRALKSAPAGARFEQRYRRYSASGGPLRRWLRLLLGVLVCLAGVVFLAIPGPGLLILLVGALLIAEQSLWMARLLDRLELRLRRRGRRRG